MKNNILKTTIIGLAVLISSCAVAQTNSLPNIARNPAKGTTTELSKKLDTSNFGTKLKMDRESNKMLSPGSKLMGGVNGGGDNPAPAPTNAQFTCDLHLTHRYTRVGKYKDGLPFSIGEHDEAYTKIDLDLSTHSIGVEKCTTAEGWSQGDDNTNPVTELADHCISIAGVDASKSVRLMLRRGALLTTSQFSMGEVQETDKVKVAKQFQSEASLAKLDANENEDSLELIVVCEQVAK